jgi:hypothetical protein
MKLSATARHIVKAGLRGLRLPLTACELATHKTGSGWPAAVAYESFDARAKGICGSILRDEELVREADIYRARMESVAHAERLERRAQMINRLGIIED